MFTKPLDVKSLYLFSGVYSGLLVILTIMLKVPLYASILAVFIPMGAVLLRLSLLSNEYTEETLVEYEPKVYTVILGIGVVFILIASFLSITASIWTALVFILSLLPLWYLSSTFGTGYKQIEFGFREILPNTQLWMSGTVCIWNARQSNIRVIKAVWYFIAEQRFKRLLSSGSTNIRYNNLNIAEQYYSSSRALRKKYTPFVHGSIQITESQLDKILASFTIQTCYRCGDSVPVSELYLLTDDGILSEAYCTPCIEDDSPVQNSKDSVKNSERLDISLDTALKVFECTDADIDAMTIDDLQSQYRKLVKDKHPDAGGNSEEFRQLNDAYSELKAYIS